MERVPVLVGILAPARLRTPMHRRTLETRWIVPSNNLKKYIIDSKNLEQHLLCTGSAIDLTHLHCLV